MTNTQFSFLVPTRVEFGEGVFQTLPQEALGLGGTRAMVVTDPGLVKLGLAGQCVQMLADAGLAVDAFDAVEPNPRDTTAMRGAAQAKNFGADLIVGLGGGSAMDVAKVIAMLQTNDGEVGDYYGYDMMSKPGIPLITIPTTAGTGSEVTIWAVITNTKKQPHAKDAVGSNLICPRVALVDPALTYGLPPHLTASTGMDALSHAVEGYTALAANPFTDIYAERAFALIAEYLPQAYARGENAEARRGMMLGQLFAGLSFSNADTHANHALAEAIGGIYDVPHGVANAIFLPHVLRYMAIADPEKHARIAHLLGRRVHRMRPLEAAAAAADAVQALSELVRIPSLREVGVREADFDVICRMAMENLGTPDAPRTMSLEGYREILENAWRAGA